MPWQNDLTLSPSAVKIIGKDGEAAFSFHSLITAPEDLSDAFWSNIDNQDTIGGSITTPDGSTSIVSGFIADDSVNWHGLFFEPTTLLDNTSYCLSTYVHAGDHTQAYLNFTTKDGTNKYCVFNLSTGAVGTNNSDDEGIEAVPNRPGWYRIWIIQNVGSGGTTPRLGLYCYDSFAGDEVTVQLYYWGAMFHEGTAPMPYLPLYADQNYRLRLVDGSANEIYGYIGGQDGEELLGNEKLGDPNFANACGVDGVCTGTWTIVGGVADGGATPYSNLDEEDSLDYATNLRRIYKIVIDLDAEGGNGFQGGIVGQSYLLWPESAMVYQVHTYNSDDFRVQNRTANLGYINSISVKQVINLGLDAVEIYNRTQWPVARNWTGDTNVFDWNDIATVYLQSEYTVGLDATAREANVRDSIKKYFVDNLHPTYPLMFDKGISVPDIRGTPSTVEKWISIDFGYMDRGDMGEHVLNVLCCTRKDEEGFKLAQLSDTVMGILSDSSMTDGMRRIDLYKSHPTDAWTKLGALLVQEVVESEQIEADDETKYKILTTRLRWSAKI